jgi:hypothetical protein
VKDSIVIPLWYGSQYGGNSFDRSKQVDGLPVKALTVPAEIRTFVADSIAKGPARATGAD